MQSKYPLSFKLAAYLVSLTIITLVLIYAKALLVPIAFAALLSLLLYPICNWLESKRVPRVLAIIFSLLLILIIISGVLIVISSQIAGFSQEIPALIERINSIFSQLQKFIQSVFDISPESQIEMIQQQLENFLSTSGAFFSTAMGTLTSFFSIISIVPVYAFLFLFYREIFKKFLYKSVNPTNHDRAAHAVEDVQGVVRSYIGGLALVTLIVAVLNCVGLYIVGVKFALFFGILAALLTIIPYIGIIIGGLLPLLMALLSENPLSQAIGVVIVLGVVQFLEGNFITPKVVGSKVSINPFAAIMALFIGAQVWGTIGMILAIPATAMIKVIADTIKPHSALSILLTDPVIEKKEAERKLEEEEKNQT